MREWIQLTDGGGRLELAEDVAEFLIGRDASAWLVLTDLGCSRRHARVVRDGESLRLEPLSTASHTIVNGSAISSPCVLSDGDELRFGDWAGIVHLLPPAATPVSVSLVASSRGGGVHASQRISPASFATSRARLSPASLQTELVLGRDASLSSFVVDHPSVSRRHAMVFRKDGSVFIRDLGSTNGTFVGGVRVEDSAVLAPQARIDLGSVTLQWTGSEIVEVASEGGAALCLQDVTLTVRTPTGEKRLLNDANLEIRAGSFVALVGPSGCGKSTLLRILAGRSPGYGGSVTFNGLELRDHFELLKQQMAYVPQRETLPEELVLREALDFTARLRLPVDSSPDVARAAVDEALNRVGLASHSATPIRRLSGGQRKRAALANELIMQPSVLFLDEVTSGLDEATDAEMMLLLRDLASGGMTVVCVTHTLSNVARNCSTLIAMAVGGYVAYDGPPQDAAAFFGVDPLGDMYPLLARVDWGARRGRHYANRVHGGPPARRVATPPMDRTAHRFGFLHQAVILAARQLVTMRADPRAVTVAALQSVLIGILIRLVFGGETLPPPREGLLGFLLGVSAFWFGCNNGSKEIVKEIPLFELERDINLRLDAYLAAKFSTLLLVGLTQVALLLAVTRVSGVQVTHLLHVQLALVGAMVTGCACGLLISSMSSTIDQAVILVPIALIPQILMSGAVVSPLPSLADAIARAGISAFWINRAQLEAIGLMTVERLPGTAVLMLHSLTYLAAAAYMLTWRDHRRRTG